MRYQKIQSSIWFDEKFKSLSEDAQFLFIYIMTCPHSNTIGIFVLPKMYVCADLGWTTERLAEPFAELLNQELILYDEQVNLICIRNHLKHNPLENQNQTKSACKNLSQLPKSSLFSNISELLNKPFHKPLIKLLREQYSEPEEETETETEEETVLSGKNERENEMVKNRTKLRYEHGRMILPTLEEISLYCKERENNVNPEKFFNYYSSVGWVVGKKMMCDWKASVRAWETPPKNSKEHAEKIEHLKRNLKIAEQTLARKKEVLPHYAKGSEKHNKTIKEIDFYQREVSKFELLLQN